MASTADHPNAYPRAGATEVATHPDFPALERQVLAHWAADGKQLVYVEGSGMKVEGLPLTVAVREPASAGGKIRIFDEKGVLYRMCGLGKDCSIPGGKPSIQRHLLLRREALELALYSFRYLDGVEQVAVLLPPPPGKTASQAVFFRKPQIAPELKKPLDATLTYQGRLRSSGQTVNMPSDLVFTLWDAPTGGTQVGSTLTANAAIRTRFIGTPTSG